ncbi:MAG: hypothetical protein K2O00_01760 [Muribaculaceae bacterium]|nr:hypothetical protein [Muribaculaceae bacterium]
MEQETLRLDVLISTYGADGIERIASHRHPQVAGVRYVVCWQRSGDAYVPEQLRTREDFDIFRYDDTGSARNRNHTLERFEAPIGMLSDDDIDYEAEELENLIRCYDERPDADMLFFKFHSANYEKSYPDHEFDFRNAPRFYYYCNFEMSFRRRAVKDRVWFDERFGLNSPFLAGEEDMFVLRALKQGARIRFIPQYNSRHDGSTTSDREGESEGMLLTRGAVISCFHPLSYPLRFVVHALRRQNRSRGFLEFLKLLFKGARQERSSRKSR